MPRVGAPRQQRREAERDLLVAASSRDVGSLEALLAGGIVVDPRRRRSTTALHTACWHGRARAVRALLRAGADVRRVNEWGCTPLHLAVGRLMPPPLGESAPSAADRIALVGALLDAGASLHARSDEGDMPLHTCAAEGCIPVVGLLLSSGADPCAKGCRGDTPLVSAARAGRRDMVDLLAVHRGSDGDLLRFPLHWAVVFGTPTETASLTTDRGSCAARDRWGWTALHLAAALGDGPKVRVLLEAGSSPSARDMSGATPLHRACEKGHTECVAAMLAAGADPSDRVHVPKRSHRPPGYTPLGVAVREGHTEVVRLLLQAGVDPDASCDDGTKSLGLVGRETPVELVRLLLEAGADPNVDDSIPPLMGAVVHCDVGLVELLLAHGADPDQMPIQFPPPDPDRPRRWDEAIAALYRQGSPSTDPD